MPVNLSQAVRKLRLRHFELLALLGQELTVRGTARRMALTQPAVSKMLREVEVCFGGELFERSRTGITPNARGVALIRHALAFLNEVRVAAEEVDAIARGASEVLRIGTFSVIPRVPVTLMRLRAAVPGVMVRVMEGTGVEMLRALHDGELDCVVCELPPELLLTADAESLRIEVIEQDRVCVMAAPGHRLARSRRLSWQDLAAEQWALPPTVNLLRRAVIDGHLQAGLPPPLPAVEMRSSLSLADMMALDSGLLGAMRLDQAHAERDAGRLKILPVLPNIALPPLALIAHRQRAFKSEAALVFRKLMREPVQRAPARRRAKAVA